jgi:hypothetical protein
VIDDAEELEAITEMSVPIDVVIAEIFQYADQFSRFNFGRTCHYFLSSKRNSSTSLPVIEVFVEAVKEGNLPYLQYWYPDHNRPKDFEILEVASFYGLSRFLLTCFFVFLID